MGLAVHLATWVVVAAPTLAPAPSSTGTTAAARADARPLTVGEARRLAKAGNVVGAQVEARIERARATYRAALAALVPSLTMNGVYTRRVSDVTRTVGGQTVVVQNANALNANLVLEATLFDARWLAAIPAAARADEATALEAQDLDRQLAYAVTSAFLAARAAERVAEAAGARVRAADAQITETRARLDAGLAGANELTRARLELGNARRAENDARAQIARTRLALAELVAPAELGTRPLLEPRLREPPPLRSSDEDTGEARGARLDLRALMLRLEQTRAAAREPLYRLVPTLGLRGTVFTSNEPGLAGRAVDANAALTLSWRLFDGGLRYADHLARLADVTDAEARVTEAERRLERELGEARVGLVVARDALAIARETVEIAEQNAAEVVTLYASGLATALERVDAAVAAYTARADLALAEVQLRLAELAVARVRGAHPAEEENP
jgi:outer membrane protein TolC